MDHEEEYCRAIDLYEADDFASAFVIFEQLANAGQPHAMAMLATMYGAGQFVAKKYTSFFGMGYEINCVGQQKFC